MIPVVVFDTNILISAILSLNGAPFRCLELARERKVESVSCDEILGEFQRKLEFKFEYSTQVAQKAVGQVRGISRMVKIPHRLKGISKDPKDEMVIECAVVGRATHIVTGDRRHLLPLGNYQGIAIVNPADFLNQLAANQVK